MIGAGAAIQIRVGQTLEFAVEVQDGPRQPTLEMTTAPPGVTSVQIFIDPPNLAKGTAWQVHEFVFLTASQVGTFEAVFTGTDPVTGATVSGTQLITVTP